ncbi:helix-turn-helix domain-containing protein [Salmonella enterica subsp. diarizonae]|nr:helix-turn-helix domain-containing protein [Salmonella enterica subsp. diarizonae]
MTIQGRATNLLNITETSEKLSDLLYVVANAIARVGGETKEIESCVAIAWEMSNSINTDLANIEVASNTQPKESTIPHSPTETIGVRIRFMRKQHGMTQGQVAEAVNITMQAVSLWESNNTVPGSDKILPLADILQCDPLWLLTGEITPQASSDNVAQQHHRASQQAGGVSREVLQQ